MNNPLPRAIATLDRLPFKSEKRTMLMNTIYKSRFADNFESCLKLVSHWAATISGLVGDKGLRYKRDFLPFFTLRSHWTFVIATYIQLY